MACPKGWFSPCCNISWWDDITLIAPQHHMPNVCECPYEPVWKAILKLSIKATFFPFSPSLVFLRSLKGEGRECNGREVFILYSCRSSFLSYPGLCLSPYLDLRYDLLRDQVGKVPGCCFALSLDFLALLFFIWGLSPPSPWQGWICLLVSPGLLSTLLFLETAELLSTMTFRLSCFHLWHMV